MSLKNDSAQYTDLGERIRTLRLRRDLSLRQLGELSEMSASNISLIERNKISPSASTLHRLASALQVQITAFFEPSGSPFDVHYCQASHHRYTRFASAVAEDLGAGGIENAPIVPILLTLEPGARSGRLMEHRGEEFVYCLEGRVVFEIEQQIFILEAGDSLLFAADKSHRWRNPGSDPVRLLMVISNTFNPHDMVTGYLNNASL